MKCDLINIVTRKVGKQIQSCPNRVQHYHRPVTSSSALSYKMLVGAKAIKLGPCDKLQAYCQHQSVDGWNNYAESEMGNLPYDSEHELMLFSVVCFYQK